MKKLSILLAAALALALGACAELQQVESYITSASVPTNDVLVAVNAFNAAEVTATNYLNYCTAHPRTAPCPIATINALGNAVHTGIGARNNIEAYIAANPTSGVVPQALFTAITSALSATTANTPAQ